ncbi:MAG: SGNH/GDSL hydrolase family protein [Kofleriaceae bacterium]
MVNVRRRLAMVGMLSMGAWGACSSAPPGGGDPPDAPVGRSDAAPTADAEASPDAAAPLTARGCFESQFVNGDIDGPDYDQFGPIIGSHCNGTNQQDITGIERVVFVGDSVTVGSPPTSAGDFYRSRLADMLVDRFGLDAPSGLWEQYDPFGGTTVVQSSGDFASCAKWGARTDDLQADNSQLEDCMPTESRLKRTLVVMTMGGNDLSSLTQNAIDGEPATDLWAQTEEFVQHLRDALDWIRAPGRFPNGVFVVFANIYEFTDATADTSACPAASAAGFGDPPPDPAALADMVIWANEQYLKAAVDTGSDMVFMLENFCGHGFHRDDPASPCYRGPGAERWFDDTCIHPNPTGHGKLAEQFFSVIAE